MGIREDGLRCWPLRSLKWRRRGRLERAEKLDEDNMEMVGKIGGVGVGEGIGEEQARA